MSLQKRASDWAVVMRSGRVVYASTCYAKAVGVEEYMQSRIAEQDAETRVAREELKREYGPDRPAGAQTQA